VFVAVLLRVVVAYQTNTMTAARTAALSTASADVLGMENGAEW
jgi:hypothetical protein